MILFNNAGVASSSGDTPETMEALADNAAAFLRAIGVDVADILGFSTLVTPGMPSDLTRAGG